MLKHNYTMTDILLIHLNIATIEGKGMTKNKLIDIFSKKVKPHNHEYYLMKMFKEVPPKYILGFIKEHNFTFQNLSDIYEMMTTKTDYDVFNIWREADWDINALKKHTFT